MTTLEDADAAQFAAIYETLLRLCVPYWGLVINADAPFVAWRQKEVPSDHTLP